MAESFYRSAATVAAVRTARGRARHAGATSRDADSPSTRTARRAHRPHRNPGRRRLREHAALARRAVPHRQQPAHLDARRDGPAAIAVPQRRSVSTAACSMKPRACCARSAISTRRRVEPVRYNEADNTRRRAGARPRRVDAEPRPVVRPQGRREQHAREVRGHELSRARQGTVARALQQRRSQRLGARLRRSERASAAGGSCRQAIRR